MKKQFVVLALMVIPSLSYADQFSLGTGFDYSSGKYGNTTSTDILYIPVVGKYETGDWLLKLTVPYISITGPGGVVQGVGRVGAMTASRTTDSGLGDIVAGVDYNFYSVGPLSLDVVGKIKFGTADANKGLGTGKNSYSGQLDAYNTSGATTLFATAGYKIYDSPPGVTLNNVVFGTVGANQKMSSTTSAGVMLDMATSSSPTGSDILEGTVYISHKITPKLKIQANVMKGFANGSPDFGGGAMLINYF